MNTENMISHIIEGILVLFAWGFIRASWKSLKKLLNAEIKNEMMKIKHSNIRNFLPAIFSFIVLAWEILYKIPYDIVDIIDFTFIMLSICLIPLNLCLVYVVGYLQSHMIRYENIYEALVEKVDYAKKMLELKEENDRLKAEIEKLTKGID